jgi:hypothetical protein
MIVSKFITNLYRNPEHATLQMVNFSAHYPLEQKYLLMDQSANVVQMNSFLLYRIAARLESHLKITQQLTLDEKSALHDELKSIESDYLISLKKLATIMLNYTDDQLKDSLNKNILIEVQCHE